MRERKNEGELAPGPTTCPNRSILDQTNKNKNNNATACLCSSESSSASGESRSTTGAYLVILPDEDNVIHHVNQLDLRRKSSDERRREKDLVAASEERESPTVPFFSLELAISLIIIKPSSPLSISPSLSVSLDCTLLAHIIAPKQIVDHGIIRAVQCRCFTSSAHRCRFTHRTGVLSQTLSHLRRERTGSRSASERVRCRLRLVWQLLRRKRRTSARLHGCLEQDDSTRLSHISIDRRRWKSSHWRQHVNAHIALYSHP